MKQFIQRNFNVDIANELGLLAKVHKTQTSFLMDEKGNVIGIKIRAKQKRLKEEMQPIGCVFFMCNLDLLFL